MPRLSGSSSTTISTGIVIALSLRRCRRAVGQTGSSAGAHLPDAQLPEELEETAAAGGGPVLRELAALLPRSRVAGNEATGKAPKRAKETLAPSAAAGFHVSRPA